ncbi:NAD(P)-binding protein, partial [Cribrihabitans sp. XS_ASV171]
MTLHSVIGAGVAGLAVATELTKRGAQVQVFDPAGG